MSHDEPSDLGPLPEDIARLLAAEREIPVERAVDQSALLFELHNQLSESSTLASASGQTWARLLTHKATVAVVSFMLGGGAVALLRPVGPEPKTVLTSPTLEVAPAPTPALPVIATAPESATPEPPKPIPRTRVVVERVPEPQPQPAPRAVPEVRSSDTQLAQERAILEVARTALGRGRGADALVALENHAREFPQGVLAEEREGLHLQALLALDRVTDARALLETIKQKYPTSILVPALEEALDQKE